MVTDEFTGKLKSHKAVRTGTATYPFTYGYAIGGNLVSEIYPSGRQLNYGYGYANQPQYLGGSLGSASTEYVEWVNFQGFKETYRSLGSLNALVLNRAYNNREQTTALTLHNWNYTDNTPNYLQFALTYNYGGSNNNGNLLSGTEQNSAGKTAVPGAAMGAVISHSYTYDSVNRLTSATDSSYVRNMCYDARGNGWVTSFSGTPGVPGNAPTVPNGACPSGAAVTPYTPAAPSPDPQ